MALKGLTIGAGIPYIGGMHFAQKHNATLQALQQALQKEKLHHCVHVEVEKDHIHFRWHPEFAVSVKMRVINDIVDQFSVRMLGAHRFVPPVKFQIGDTLLEVISVDPTSVFLKQNGEYTSYKHTHGEPVQDLCTPNTRTLPTTRETEEPRTEGLVESEYEVSESPTSPVTTTYEPPPAIDFFDDEVFDMDESYNVCNMTLTQGPMSLFMSVVSDEPFDISRREHLSKVLTRTYVNVAECNKQDPENEIYIVTRCKRQEKGEVKRPGNGENPVTDHDKEILDVGEVRVMRARTVYETQKRREDMLKKELQTSILTIENLRRTTRTKIEECVTHKKHNMAKTAQIEELSKMVIARGDECDTMRGEITELKIRDNRFKSMEELCTRNQTNIIDISRINTEICIDNDKMELEIATLCKAKEAITLEKEAMRTKYENIMLQKKGLLQESERFLADWDATKAASRLLYEEQEAKNKKEEKALKRALQMAQNKLKQREQELKTAKESMSLSSAEYSTLFEEHKKDIRLLQLKNAEIERRGLEIKRRDAKLQEVLKDSGSSTVSSAPSDRVAWGAKSAPAKSAPAKSAPAMTLSKSELEEQFALKHDSFVCPIGLVVMRDPVVAADGHSYERELIEGHIHRHRQIGLGEVRSPLSNAPLSHVCLTPNIALLAAISDALEASGLGRG